MKTTTTTPSELTGIKPTNKRYYCRYYEATGNHHCDDRPMTIQCEYCTWKEQGNK